MSDHEPEITKIAAYIAYRVPTEGVKLADAHEGWRQALRYARSSGAIDEVVEKLNEVVPEDEELQAYCEELKR